MMLLHNMAVIWNDNFDSADLSPYSDIGGGTWSTASEVGRGTILTENGGGNYIFYHSSLNIVGSYVVNGTINGTDNDAMGVAFRVDTADPDNFYSCSATSDSGFDAGIWRHTNDLSGTPSSAIATTPWNFVEDRWYNVTISVNENTNQISCIWESSAGGIELNVSGTDDDVRETGSIGFWKSSQAGFAADLLYAARLPPPTDTFFYPDAGAPGMNHQML